MHNKAFCTYFAILLTLSVITQAVSAQSQPQPAPPEFTVQAFDYSYMTSPTPVTQMDPYTGENSTYNPPQQIVTIKPLELKIYNQQFTPYTDQSGNQIRLYYNISMKPRYGGEWTYYPNSQTPMGYEASNQQYTTLTFGWGGYADQVTPRVDYLKPGGEVDISLQAQIGYYQKTYVDFTSAPQAGIPIYVFVGQTSNWSTPQTLKLPSDPFLPSPSVPEFPSWTLLALLFAPIVAAVFIRRKHNKKPFP